MAKHTWTVVTALAALKKCTGLTRCSAYDYLTHRTEYTHARLRQEGYIE